MEQLRASVRNTARVVWTAAAVPVVAVVASSEGTPRIDPWLVGEAAAATVLGLALHLPGLPERARNPTIVGALTGVAAFALLHYGPLLGTGLLFVLPPLFATVLLGERAAWLTWGTLVVAAGGVAGAAGAGWVSPRVALGPADWVRVVGTTALGLGACTWVLVQLYRSFVAAITAQADEIGRAHV
jgi:hypothetical protein